MAQAFERATPRFKTVAGHRFPATARVRRRVFKVAGVISGADACDADVAASVAPSCATAAGPLGPVDPVKR